MGYTILINTLALKSEIFKVSAFNNITQETKLPAIPF